MNKVSESISTGAAYLVWAALGLGISLIGWLAFDDTWGRIAAVLFGVSVGLVSGFELIARGSYRRRAAGMSEEYDPDEDEDEFTLNPGSGMPMVNEYLDLWGSNRGFDDGNK